MIKFLKAQWKKLIVASIIPAAFILGAEVVPEAPSVYLTNPNVTDPIQVQIKYKMSEDKLEYQDSLFYTAEEYEKLTQAEIDAEKQKRFDTWLTTVENPPVFEPTLEQLEEEKALLEKQLAEVNENIDEKTP